MRSNIGKSPRSIATLYRPDHDESGKYTVHTVIHDDAILERNKRIRLESLLTTRSKLNLHENERIDYAFSIPQESWTFFKRDFPDIANGLHSKDEAIRYKSARELAILHPEWVIMAGNR